MIVFHKQTNPKRSGIPFAKLMKTKSALQIRINADACRIIACKYKNAINCDVEFSSDEKILRIKPSEHGEYSMTFEYTHGIRIGVHSLFNHSDFMDYDRHPIEFHDDYFDIIFGKELDDFY